jgi:hypothetical protein
MRPSVGPGAGQPILGGLDEPLLDFNPGEVGTLVGDAVTFGHLRSIDDGLGWAHDL